MMSKKRILHVELTTLGGALQHFARTWDEAAAGKAVKPYEGVSFETMEEFLSAFTPRRWALIRELSGAGPVTIYALAKQLNRDYKNVHGDVAVLMNLGVIAKDADGRVSVPYDEIEARLPLGVAA